MHALSELFALLWRHVRAYKLKEKREGVVQMDIGKRPCMALLSVISLAGCGSQEGAKVVPGKVCGVDQRHACRLSFRALAAAPRLFDGKSVRIEGYLGVSAGHFVLSSSKELFEAGVTGETEVRIRGPMDVQERAYNRHAYSWVSVMGVFRLRGKDGSTDDLLLGEIHAPLHVQSLRIPGPIPRATFGDVYLDLEDLN